ncbi:class I SAM-dependent methyltransferase [Halioglobus maricola]|uniref:Class I SAM-dependent methyltransferase n=1 Tax=Halioglobus maricola TaxID=2601894 RepID=A0A5P9NJG0_9GAMM|nr:class I SAM-dependent methyltransferase [Halioglobus maricola]QFU75971.1 class I SAM-dependent methyltransferase [Halioglobus maricola]
MSQQFSEIFNELESWYGSEPGQLVLDKIRTRVNHHLDTAFGYHILQLGPVRDESLISDGRIHHHIYAGPRAGGTAGMLCDAGELPLASDSVDVIVAHHSLEFSTNPHQVLRELQRVLTPQGHLLIVGFNPLSFRGLGLLAKRLGRYSPWRRHHPVSQNRLYDWLRLVGCDPDSSSFLHTVPGIGGGRLRSLLERFDSWCGRHSLPLGGVYVVHAIKQQPGLTESRLGLRSRGEKLMGLAVPKPAPRPSPAPAAPTRGPHVGAVRRRPSGEIIH